MFCQANILLPTGEVKPVRQSPRSLNKMLVLAFIEHIGLPFTCLQQLPLYREIAFGRKSIFLIKNNGVPRIVSRMLLEENIFFQGQSCLPNEKQFS